MSFQLSSYTSYLLKLKINSVHAESPMAKTFDNLCLRDFSYGRPLFASKTKNVHSGRSGWLVSFHTSYLLYKVQDPFSACRQSQNI